MQIGFQRYNITNYLNATSITIYGHVMGRGYIHLYSSEYGGDQNKLPQLIWS